jgi:hypothetical protein
MRSILTRGSSHYFKLIVRFLISHEEILVSVFLSSQSNRSLRCKMLMYNCKIHVGETLIADKVTTIATVDSCHTYHEL